MKELHSAHKADRKALLNSKSARRLGCLSKRRGIFSRGKVDLNLNQEQRDALRSLKVAHKETYSALRQEHKEAFTAILTGKQVAALEILRSANSERGPRRGRAGRVPGGRADAGGHMSESSLQWFDGSELPTAVESTSWGRIKKDQAEQILRQAAQTRRSKEQ